MLPTNSTKRMSPALQAAYAAVENDIGLAAAYQGDIVGLLSFLNNVRRDIEFLYTSNEAFGEERHVYEHLRVLREELIKADLFLTGYVAGSQPSSKLARSKIKVKVRA